MTSLKRLESYVSGGYEDFRGIFKLKERILWMNFYQAVNIVTAVLTSVAFARLASQSLYGQYIFVLSMLSVVSLVSMPGVRTTIFRSVSQGKDGFYREATRFNISWSLVGIPVLMISGLYVYFSSSFELGTAIIFASLFFPFLYSLQNWKNLYKAKERFRSFVLYESTLSVTRALLVLGVLLWNAEGLLPVLAVYLVSNTLFNGYFFLKSLNLISEEVEEFNWKSESYEYTLLNFTVYAFSKMDRILIGMFLPFSQVAVYNIAMKVSDTFFKFLQSSIEAVLPNFFKDDFAFSDFYLVFGLLFFVPILLWPVIDYPIIFLYTEKYASSVLYAKIYLFSVPFYFLAYVATQTLIKHEMGRQANKARIASIIVFLASSLVLIPNLKVLGAVLASLIYYPVQLIFSGYYLRRNNLLVD